MSSAPERRSSPRRALWATWADRAHRWSHWSLALAHEAVGHLVLRTALPRVSRFSRARRWFDAGLSWLSDAGSADRTRFRLRIAVARCAYGMGDYLGWRGACGAARSLDPKQFGGLPHPFSLFEVVQPHLGTWPGSLTGDWPDAGGGPRPGVVLGRPGLATPEGVSALQSRSDSTTRPDSAAKPDSAARPDSTARPESAARPDEATRQDDGGRSPEAGDRTDRGQLGGGAPHSEAADPSGSGAGTPPAADPAAGSGHASSPAPESAEDGIADIQWLEEVLREFDERPEGQARAVDRSGADDCRDEGERRRFDALGPVDREEILRADLDSLARRLSDQAP